VRLHDMSRVGGEGWEEHPHDILVQQGGCNARALWTSASCTRRAWWASNWVAARIGVDQGEDSGMMARTLRCTFLPLQQMAKSGVGLPARLMGPWLKQPTCGALRWVLHERAVLAQLSHDRSRGASLIAGQPLNCSPVPCTHPCTPPSHLQSVSRTMHCQH
jgi:hypothetical protein